MSDIAITSAMRRNLLSLQNTSKLMDMTSDRLSTGRKVNSALDNPSSFFTARGLTNRAGDLSSLLDAMGQGIQTLKAAEEGINTITDLVSQAKAVADEAFEAAAAADKGASLTVPVGGSGATHSFNFAGLTGGSSLHNGATDATLTLTDGDTGSVHSIAISSSMTLTDLQGSINNIAGITAAVDGSNLTIQSTGADASDFDIALTGALSGVAAAETAINTMVANDITGDIDSDAGMLIGDATSATISVTTEDGSKKFDVDSNTKISDFVDWVNDNIGGADASFDTTNGLQIDSDSGITFEGLNGTVLDAGSVGGMDGHQAGRTLTFGVKLEDSFTALGAGSMVFGSESVTTTGVETGADLYNALKDNLSSDWDVGTDSEGFVTVAYAGSSTSAVEYTADTTNETMFLNDGTTTAANALAGSFNVSGSVDNAELVSQFNDLMTQVDAATSDASYKGINLLNGSDLTVNFNEDRTSSKTISGVTFDSSGLGFTTASGWSTTTDIQTTLDQVSSATETLRAQSAKFGREAAVIQTRQDFTENMINTLEEGADNLTLADMNEEGANMLALQTRQQLATSSLSMASQASQAVLSLFR